MVSVIINKLQELAVELSDSSLSECVPARLDPESSNLRINLQQSGSKAKPYQVKQVRSVIVKYGLKVTDDG